MFFDSESNDSNFSSLAPPGGEKNYFEFFFQTDVTSRRLRTIFDFMTAHILKNHIFSRHKVALESSNYDHSTQNRKLHQAVVTVWFRKVSPLTVCFHSTNKKNWHFDLAEIKFK